MSSTPLPRLYTDLVNWWPLFSPPSHYVEEAADLLPDLLNAPDAPPAAMLELGSGAGSLAFHFKTRMRLTLTDLSSEMLAMSRTVNPECEHLQGDMRTINLGRQFDLVFIHDAILYLTDTASVRAAIANAGRHCRPGGGVVIVPDCVRETFAPETTTGGDDHPDGRGLRYLQWTWDQNPHDTTTETQYAFLLRAADGSVTVDHDRHTCGLFARAEWLAWMEEAGLRAQSRMDRWERDVFVSRKSAA